MTAFHEALPAFRSEDAYTVSHDCNHEEVNLELSFFVYSTATEIDALASQPCHALLKQDGLHVTFAGQYEILTDEKTRRYRFSLCTKELPPPIALSDFRTDEDVRALMNDDRYMVTADDFQPVDWTLSAAFHTLKAQYPEREEFLFSSLAYGYRTGSL